MAKIDLVPVPGGKVKLEDKEVVVKPFFMATTETTWDMFDVFLASGDPSKPYDQTVFAPDAIARPSRSYNLPDRGWGHKGYPVISLHTDSAQMFCKWLSKVTGKKYRLPTVAEWEWAAMEASTSYKLDSAGLEKTSWNGSNSEGQTHPVGAKAANKLGLHDMFGNVGEWALDLDGKPILCGPTFADPLSTVKHNSHQRWDIEWQQSDPQMPKSRWWLSDGPFAGFRVVCEG